MIFVNMFSISVQSYFFFAKGLHFSIHFSCFLRARNLILSQYRSKAGSEGVSFLAGGVFRKERMELLLHGTYQLLLTDASQLRHLLIKHAHWPWVFVGLQEKLAHGTKAQTVGMKAESE